MVADHFLNLKKIKGAIILEQGSNCGQHSFSPKEEFGIFEKHHFAKEVASFLGKYHDHDEALL